MKQEQKLMLALIGWTLLSGSIYIGLIYLEIVWGILFYMVAAGALLVAFTVLNKGMTLEKPIPGDAESEKRYNQSKQLLVLAFPMILFSMLDMILLMFGLNLASLL